MFTIIALWQMLLPGYVLTLDMIFTPNLPVSFSDGEFLNVLPIKYLLSFMNLLLSGWMVQKVMLVVLFFLLFFLALKYFPVSKKYYTNYFAAIFYSINPFVYERFLAGHWTHLMAYALMPAFIYFVLKFSDDNKWKDMFWLLFWIVLIGMFSLQFFVVAVLILIVERGTRIAERMIRNNKSKNQEIKKTIINSYIRTFRNFVRSPFVVLILLLVICSLYWTVPYLLNSETSVLNIFNAENQLAFKTIGENGLETIFNVGSLYGFWAENQPWASYFLWPKDHLVLWWSSFVLLFGLIGSGVYYAFWKKQKNRFFFLIIGIVAFVLSCGLGESPFKFINQFLFDHVGFWKGFRDTQKFSGILILSYVYFASMGFYFLADLVFKYKRKLLNYVLFVMLALPVLFTYPMVGGFARQVKAVEYPDSWFEAKEIIDQDQTDYKVLFLPWHQYLSLDFNNYLICANPAKKFFGEKIIQSNNMELNGVGDQGNNGENVEIERIMFNQKILEDEKIELLKKNGVKYIIVMTKVAENDYLNYDFLKSANLEVKTADNRLTVFEVK